MKAWFLAQQSRNVEVIILIPIAFERVFMFGQQQKSNRGDAVLMLTIQTHPVNMC